MGRKPAVSTSELGARERQILDVIFRLGEASVGEVHQVLEDAPSYSAVRTMIRLLESKGFLKHREEGVKYIYRPTESKERASKSALSHLLKTFFSGSAADALAALLEVPEANCTEEELARMRALVDEARKQERGGGAGGNSTKGRRS